MRIPIFQRIVLFPFFYQCLYFIFMVSNFYSYIEGAIECYEI